MLKQFLDTRISGRPKLSALCILVGAVLAPTLLWMQIGQKTPAVTQQNDMQKIILEDLLAGEWSYMPGVTRESEGLRIHDWNFSFVNQNGVQAQTNPPLNLFGTRLDTRGDFAVEATLKIPAKTIASLQLYGEVPIFLDEFRIERRSLQLTLQDNRLTVVEQGDNVAADADQTFSFATDQANHLRIERHDKTVSISINGQEIGQVPEQGIFQTGVVWFGLNSQGGSWQLSKLKATALRDGRVTAANAATIKIKDDYEDSLQDLADRKRPGFLIGAAAALAPAVSDKAYARLLLGGNFGTLTTENVLKWQFVHPTPHDYSFGEADALIALAERHGLKVHAHTLVFGEANPRWVQDLPIDQREQAMREHITTVAGRYKDRVSSWDVVNEPFDDEAWDQLRPNIWYQAMGESYIAKAFRAAHQTAPRAQLFINEYGLEEDSERWDAMLALLKRLQSEKVPIDGVGFQAHVYERDDKINPTILRKHIRQLHALGLKARISEIDVYSEDSTAVQASQYSEVLKTCLAEPNCVSYTTWGVSDRYNWFEDDGPQQGQDFLWDANMQPTPAVQALRQVLYE